MNNPERPFITLIPSHQRQFHFYLVVEVLVLYIHWVMYLWSARYLNVDFLSELLETSSTDSTVVVGREFDPHMEPHLREVMAEARRS